MISSNNPESERESPEGCACVTPSTESSYMETATTPADLTSRMAVTGEKTKSGARNACKLCTPLGACMVFAGVQGCVPFLHGSQGCATYIRRYMISHFREPVDIASSSFSEEDAVFGGGYSLKLGLGNVVEQYAPSCIGVATTCLSETIGEDVPGLIREIQDELQKGSESEKFKQTPIAHVSTASYRGTHYEGFNDACLAMTRHFARSTGEISDSVNLLPGMVSTADLRYLKELCERFGIRATMLPDYSETLDGESWKNYTRIQSGGTPVSAIRGMANARGTIECGRVLEQTKETVAAYLKKKFSVPAFRTSMPIGLRETDRFIDALVKASGGDIPLRDRQARGRLVDSLVDGHKYTFGKRVAIYGEPDFVVGMASFCLEIGLHPVLCATGAHIKKFKELLCASIALADNTAFDLEKIEALSGCDHSRIREMAHTLKPDLMIGSSKGYPVARELGIPLIRAGFPVHDRIGGQRLLHLGYDGAQRLFDEIVNAILEHKQSSNSIGYSYL